MANEDRIRTLQSLNDALTCEIESMARQMSELTKETEQAKARAEQLQSALLELLPIIEAARSWDTLRTDLAAVKLLREIDGVTRWPEITVP